MTYHLRVAEEEEEREGEREREGEKEREGERERGRERERAGEGERDEKEGERRRERIEEFQIHPRSGVLPPNYHADIKVRTTYSQRRYH